MKCLEYEQPNCVNDCIVNYLTVQVQYQLSMALMLCAVVPVNISYVWEIYISKSIILYLGKQNEMISDFIIRIEKLKVSFFFCNMVSLYGCSYLPLFIRFSNLQQTARVRIHECDANSQSSNTWVGCKQPEFEHMSVMQTFSVLTHEWVAV